MNASVGPEVIQGQVTTMNIDSIDTPLSDVPFLTSQMDLIAKMPTEGERLDAIETLLNWQDPGLGGFYDDLGPRSSDGKANGHLNLGPGPNEDPAYYFRSVHKHSVFCL